MDFELSQRVQRIKSSATLAITTRANELRAAGKDVIGLGAGEPDFDTPEHIKKAAISAINAGFTKYTAVDGTPDLKQAIINKFQRDNQLQYNADQILVSCGGKQSFFNLCQALLNKGDEVIIPSPYWVSYPDMVLLANGSPKFINADISQNFRITAEQLDAAITPKTRLFVINSPSNPTGMCYSHQELAELAAVLIKHPQIIIATDDMYEHILWQNEVFKNIVTVEPNLFNRTIVLNGVSKAYSMTGWRIGYAAGPVELIKAMKKIQSQSTSNPTSISQVAAQAALTGDQSCITGMLSAFKERHDKVIPMLNEIDGISCLPSSGTFYTFPSVSGLINRINGVNNDVELAEYILNTVGVAAVPGSAFGLAGYLRLSYATSMENLTTAIKRIASL
ncbi:Aspartate aminotransferase [hydrothermal vent metagenome]|uniref:Aspartate aminotransferase n=1 Tax=hydrothermal vent metagenome TaxID=652676 RepID=A0A3B0ZJQ7_9ZZZZ